MPSGKSGCRRLNDNVHNFIGSSQKRGVINGKGPHRGLHTLPHKAEGFGIDHSILLRESALVIHSSLRISRPGPKRVSVVPVNLKPHAV